MTEVELALCSNRENVEEKNGRVQKCNLQHAHLPCRVSRAAVKGHQQQSKQNCSNEKNRNKKKTHKEKSDKVHMLQKQQQQLAIPL